MNLSKRTIIAIALNIILPGTGYLLIRAKNRYWLATILITLTIVGVFTALVNLSRGLSMPFEFSLFFPQSDKDAVSLPGLILLGILITDTYNLATKPQSPS